MIGITLGNLVARQTEAGAPKSFYIAQATITAEEDSYQSPRKKRKLVKSSNPIKAKQSKPKSIFDLFNENETGADVKSKKRTNSKAATAPIKNFSRGAARRAEIKKRLAAEAARRAEEKRKKQEGIFDLFDEGETIAEVKSKSRPDDSKRVTVVDADQLRKRLAEKAARRAEIKKRLAAAAVLGLEKQRQAEEAERLAAEAAAKQQQAEEERKAREAALALEKQRQAEEAERQRLAAEAAAKAEEERKAREAALALEKQRQAEEAERLAAEAAAKQQQAEEERKAREAALALEKQRQAEEAERLAAEAAAKQQQAEEERKAREAALALEKQRQAEEAERLAAEAAAKQQQAEEERKSREAALALEKQRQAEEAERLADSRKVASIDSASEANEASSKSCNKAKSIIGKYGFEDIEAKSCRGKVYHFSATRNGKRFSVKISALTLELTEIKKVLSSAPE